MSSNPVSARIASRPDLVKEFVTIETNLVDTLRQGGEVGELRRSFENLTARTMKELGLAIKPRGADYALADLTISARALNHRMQNPVPETHHMQEAEEITTPARRVRMGMGV